MCIRDRAWVEYLNRLFGALVGLIILITFILGYVHFKKSKKVFVPITVAFFLTLLEGWVGAKLVDTVLDPITITIHLLLALVIIGLIIYSAIQAYYAIAGNFESKSSYHPHTKPIILGILICIFIEIIIGTEIRGGLDMSRKENPLIEGVILLKMLGPFKYMHTILGFSLLGLTIYLWKIVNDIKFISSSFDKGFFLRRRLRRFFGFSSSSFKSSVASSSDISINPSAVTRAGSLSVNMRVADFNLSIEYSGVSKFRSPSTLTDNP